MKKILIVATLALGAHQYAHTSMPKEVTLSIGKIAGAATTFVALKFLLERMFLHLPSLGQHASNIATFGCAALITHTATPYIKKIYAKLCQNCDIMYADTTLNDSYDYGANCAYLASFLSILMNSDVFFVF